MAEIFQHFGSAAPHQGFVVDRQDRQLANRKTRLLCDRLLWDFAQEGDEPSYSGSAKLRRGFIPPAPVELPKSGGTTKPAAVSSGAGCRSHWRKPFLPAEVGPCVSPGTEMTEQSDEAPWLRLRIQAART